MNRLADTISTIIRTFAERRRLRVGLIFNGNRPVAENVIACGQRTLVLSESFHPLFRLFKTLAPNGESPSSDSVLMVETKLNAVPVAQRSLDVLVLTAGLPWATETGETLVNLRELLKPGGLLIWTHSSDDGVLTRFFSHFHVGPKQRQRRMRRAELCRVAMAAGFCEVGQAAISQTFGNWVVTTGRRGIRPWEGSNPLAQAMR